jgi:GT2 family glycosyltransferase
MRTTARYRSLIYALASAGSALRTLSFAPLRRWRVARIIAKSGVFNTDWYLRSYPDVAAAGIDPVHHYIAHGAAEGRKPAPSVDTRGYLSANPDVAAGGMDPLLHYILHGRAEGRRINSFSRVENTKQVPSSPALPPVLEFGTKTNTWSDYPVLAHQIAAVRDQARQQFQPKPRALIRVGPDDPIAFAQKIKLATLQGEPLVSIVVPVYDAAQHALECLASIAAHSGDTAYEVIVIDDASSEQTMRILSSVRNLTYIRNETNIGFIKSCNRASKQARAQHIVLLNSDTQVCAGWLDALLRCFTEEQNVGAAGAKLIFPDGRLQEAGALINRDGTATLIGLFDDPNLPRYNRRREVAYCSGACLMVQTEAFRALGGFDEVFAPAYCEDADLCFRLRAAGLRVIYCPDAVVVHHLSVSVNSVSNDYKTFLAIRNQQRFCERWQQEIDSANRVRVLAFYLPQFHPIPENDLWWSKGFTEWRNVVKARPNFEGHEQPRLPADLGFYDLRVAAVMDEQAKLAKQYGIHGFCFYYYWFNGRRILELPLERLLQTEKQDIPFCIAWANENWTRRWDGRDHDILLAQRHSLQDDEAVIRDMIRYLRHPNYIRVNGRRLLVVYWPSKFPDSVRTTEVWRNVCREEGLGEIYLAMVGSFEHASCRDDPADLGFDAIIEFPPHGTPAPMDPPGRSNPNFEGVVHNYREIVLKYTERELPRHVMFRGVMPGWDNTPRNQNNPGVFFHSSPGAYQAWLEAVMKDARETNYGDEQLVFVNAWNEWAEGAYLEPDARFGHQFLEATRNAHDAWMTPQR